MTIVCSGVQRRASAAVLSVNVCADTDQVLTCVVETSTNGQIQRCTTVAIEVVDSPFVILEMTSKSVRVSRRSERELILICWGENVHVFF
jgi:hypothetical protein